MFKVKKHWNGYHHYYVWPYRTRKNMVFSKRPGFHIVLWSGYKWLVFPKAVFALRLWRVKGCADS